MNKLPEKIQEIVDKIVREYQPEKIILFGSWAWGAPHEDSDVDLLIVKESSRPRIERAREINSLLFPTNVPLDLLVYTHEELEQSINHSRNLFLEDVVQNGRIVYEQPNSQLHLTHQPAELITQDP